MQQPAADIVFGPDRGELQEHGDALDQLKSLMAGVTSQSLPGSQRRYKLKVEFDGSKETGIAVPSRCDKGPSLVYKLECWVCEIALLKSHKFVKRFGGYERAWP